MAATCNCQCSQLDELHHSQFWSKLEELRTQQSFCDVTIIVNGAIFPAHKVVLSAATEYFNAMFLSGLYEQTSHEINLQGIDNETFDVLLHFMYTGNVVLSPENAGDVLVAADMLNLTSVVKKCLTYLQSNLTVSNCLSIWTLAEMHSFNGLYFTTERFVQENFQELILSPCFYDIQFSFIFSLVISEDIRIDGEIQLLSVIIHWVSYNVQERVQYLNQLLNQVRLPMINKSDAKSEVDKITDVWLRERVSDIIGQNQQYKRPLTPTNVSPSHYERICDYDSWVCKQHVPRKNARKFILVIGGCASARGGDFSGGHGLVTTGGGPFRMEDTMESFDCVEKYDTYGANWEIVPKLNQARSGHCAVRCRNLVYVLGNKQFQKNRIVLHHMFYYVMEKCELRFRRRKRVDD